MSAHGGSSIAGDVELVDRYLQVVTAAVPSETAPDVLHAWGRIAVELTRDRDAGRAALVDEIARMAAIAAGELDHAQLSEKDSYLVNHLRRLVDQLEELDEEGS